jgi:hypothetical protein
MRSELRIGRGHSDDHVAWLIVGRMPYLEHERPLDAGMAAAPQRRSHATQGFGRERRRGWQFGRGLDPGGSNRPPCAHAGPYSPPRGAEHGEAQAASFSQAGV